MRNVILPSLFALTTAASAQQPGTLESLVRPRNTRIAHYSSFDPQQKNDGFRRVGPGETVTLVDHRGAGTLRRWWITIAPRNNVAIQRQLIVHAWWDDEETPSIEVPVSDFFGMVGVDALFLSNVSFRTGAGP